MVEALLSSGSFLIDTLPVRLQLVESKETDNAGKKKCIVRGIFGRVGTPTNNGRVYPGRIMERELTRLSEDLSHRRCFGELDHPADGRTKLTRVSHIITTLKIEDGAIIGEAEILDTEAGRTLKAIIEAGGEVGVSSRGMGTTDTDTNGHKVVRSDYKLMTFDFVAEPATPGAYPRFFMEGMGDVDLKDLTTDQLRKIAPDKVREIELAVEARVQAQAKLVEEQEVKLTTEFNKKLDEAVTAAKADAEQKLTEAEAVVQQSIKQLEDAKAERAKLKEDLSQAIEMGRVVGYRYRLEERLRETPHAARVKAVVGDPSKYASLDELDEKIDEAFASVLAEAEESERKLSIERRKMEREVSSKKKLVEEEAGAVAALREQIEGDAKQRKVEAKRLKKMFESKFGELQSEVGKMRREKADMQEKFTKAVGIAEELGAIAHAEQKIAHRPDAPKVRRLVRAMRPQSKEQVDGLLDSLREDTQPQDDNSEFQRIRRHVKKSKTPLTEDVEVRGADSDKIFGLSMRELSVLAGIDDGSKE